MLAQVSGTKAVAVVAPGPAALPQPQPNEFDSGIELEQTLPINFGAATGNNGSTQSRLAGNPQQAAVKMAEQETVSNGTPPDATSSKHWSHKIRQTRLSATQCLRDAVTLRGGSDYGEFVVIGQLRSGEIRKRAQFVSGDIVVRLQGQSISGFTLRDGVDWLKALVDAGTEEIVFETVKNGLLPKKLKPFLRKRFQRGSPDHLLQQTIRNNLYLRTVPCTTRPRREGEADGTHYRFVTVQQFKQLERNNELLEYGMYSGNYYGTPKPPVDATALRLSLSLSNLAARAATDSAPTSASAVRAPLQLANPGSASASASNSGSVRIERDDRQIQRSLAGVEQVEAPVQSTNLRSRNSVSARSSPIHLRKRVGAVDSLSQRSSSAFDHSARPIVPNAATAAASLLFTNSNSIAAALNNPQTPSMSTSLNESTAIDVDADRTLTRSVKEEASQVLDTLKRSASSSRSLPLSNIVRNDALHIVTSDLLEASPVANSSAKTPNDEEDLPYGWECVQDPQYGVYYIDHVQKKTQYEHPSVTLKDQVAIARPPAKQLESPIIPYNAVPPFSHDASRLPGELIVIELVKGIRGFGFSLVGSDRSDDSYLQVKSVLRNGPADVDGRLSRGDILVAVNDQSVLGYSYEQVVQLFQSIAVGSHTEMTISKYYRLPLDDATGTPPRVVRQVAVDPVELLPNLNSAAATASQPQPQQQPQQQDQDELVSAAPVVEDQQGLVRIRLRKMEQTFGFTIARNANGLHYIHNISPRVEQCRALRIGDILFSLDENNILQASHSEIVALFKRVQPGQEVQLTVLRVQPSNSSAVAAEPSESSVNTADTLDGHSPFDEENESPIVPTVRRRAQTPHLSTKEQEQTRSDQPARPSSVTPIAAIFNSSNYAQLNATQPPIAADLLVPASLASPQSNQPDDSVALQIGLPQATPLPPPQLPINSASLSPPMQNWDSFEVRLRRNEKGFGFRLVGGYEHGQQVAIGYVQPGSPADEAGLRSADQIVAIDRVVMLGAAHADAVRLLTQASRDRGECTLRVRRRTDVGGSSAAVDWNKIERGSAMPPVSGMPPDSGYSSGPASNSNASTTMPFGVTPLNVADSQSSASASASTQSGAERLIEITLRRLAHETFGFVIVSSTTRTGQYVGEFVGRVVAGSPADRCAQLKVGQRLAAINGVPVNGLSHESVVQLIKNSGLVLSLTLIDTATHAPPALIPLPPAMSAQVGVDAIAALNLHQAAFRPDSVTQTDGLQSQTPTESILEVELVRAATSGFGFSLRGGREFGQPLVVHKIADGSCAARDGRISVGDQILAINSRPAVDLSHQQAVELVQSCGQRVQLLLRKINRSQRPALSKNNANARSHPNLGPGHGNAVSSFDASSQASKSQQRPNAGMTPQAGRFGPNIGSVSAAPQTPLATTSSAVASTPRWATAGGGASNKPPQSAAPAAKLYNYTPYGNNYNSSAAVSVASLSAVPPVQFHASAHAPNLRANPVVPKPPDANGKSSAPYYGQHSNAHSHRL